MDKKIFFEKLKGQWLCSKEDFRFKFDGNKMYRWNNDEWLVTIDLDYTMHNEQVKDISLTFLNLLELILNDLPYGVLNFSDWKYSKKQYYFELI